MHASLPFDLSNKLLSHCTDKKKIYIETETGDTITLEIDPTETVKNVKLMIQEEERVPPGQQCLFFFNKELDDSQTLSAYNIQRESVLQVVYRIQHTIQIIVKTRTGKTITIEVDSTESIENVKRSIQIKEGISPDQQLLTYHGLKLEDEHYLHECDIHDQSTIMLAVHKKALQISIDTTGEETVINVEELSLQLFLENVASVIPGKWYLMGTELDLRMGTIRAIAAEEQENLQRFAKVFDHWQKNPTPQRPFCWDTVVKVLRSSDVNEPELANKIAKDFIDK